MNFDQEMPINCLHEKVASRASNPRWWQRHLEKQQLPVTADLVREYVPIVHAKIA
jgi:hypothetical protein